MYGRPWQLAANPARKADLDSLSRDATAAGSSSTASVSSPRMARKISPSSRCDQARRQPVFGRARQRAHRPSSEPESRIFWIRGVKAQFDRVTVRIAHVADDARYVGASETRTSLPAVQWTLVVGEGHLRFYATAAIPTGLFHITAPSGILTLNFGVLSRLTWLDQEGHEGLVGLELGAMGVGLATTTDYDFPPTLAVLGGLGVSIPIGNRGEPTQAAVNLHAWVAYELRDDYTTLRDHPRSRPATGRFFSDRASPSATSERISDTGRCWHDLC